MAEAEIIRLHIARSTPKRVVTDSSNNDFVRPPNLFGRP